MHDEDHSGQPSFLVMPKLVAAAGAAAAAGAGMAAVAEAAAVVVLGFTML